MRSARIKTVVLIWLVFWAFRAAEAQEITLMSQWMQGPTPLLRFTVGEGRFVPRCWQPVNFPLQTRKNPGNNESFQLICESGQTKLTYQRIKKDEDLKIEAEGGTVRIRREPKGNASFPAVEFRQVPNEKITLTVGAGDSKQIYRADDCWRLFLIYPKECREHLSPLLVFLRPNWKSTEPTAAIEAKLLQEIVGDAAAQRAHWAELVKQLGDDRFARREAADRALRASGTAVLGFLRQLDVDPLDAEQRFRIRRIIGALNEQVEDDSPDQIASLLAADPEIWLILLERPEAAVRKAAARNLALLLGSPVEIDPAADPATQKAKREQLRAKIQNQAEESRKHELTK
jgi:hypothetical protein